MSDRTETVTACVLIIGNEILSGRTRDKNLADLAARLNELGIQVRECRVVPDVEQEIVAAVNACRQRYDYVFTTGGIGPTHDDITADSIAAAFGVRAEHDPRAVALLQAHYAGTGIELNEARMRMARIPAGARLLENPVSKAPGFAIENVFVLAGVPAIARAMFESLRHELVGGAPLRSVTIAAYLPEGSVAGTLAQIQARHSGVDIGSYPFYRDGGFGTSIVCRSPNEDRLEAAAEAVRAMIRDLGGEPVADANDPA